MERKNKTILSCAGIAVILGSFIAANVEAMKYQSIITTALCGTGISFEGEEVKKSKALGDALCRSFGDEGIVMLKNINNTLPLAKDDRKVNVFGWGALDNGFMTSGGGSTFSTVSDDLKVTFLSGLKDNGFTYNEDLLNVYSNFCNTTFGKDSRPSRIMEPDQSVYTDTLINSCKEFSSTAIVVLNRFNRENGGEVPDYQLYYGSDEKDTTKTYYQISDREKSMLGMVENNFEKVIVILNTCNAMQCDFLKDEKIGACLNVGITGQSGAAAIGRILTGEVTPSGHLTDTYVYDQKKDPTFANKYKTNNNQQYTEDIYFGYRWYETADEEGYFKTVNNEYGKGYDGVVQFPFGYGLSYTSFEWNVTGVSLTDGDALTAKSEVTMTVDVTNTGTVKGKDVIQLYGSAPYIKGGIEKSSIQLLDFAKTEELEPGKTQKGLTLNFSAYELASYDCYDKNGNGKTSYELDPGNYKIQIKSDVHSAASDTRNCSNAVFNYNVPSTIVFKRDPKTRTLIKNQFTGDNAYLGIALDGSNVGANKTYLSRTDFAGTFPTTASQNPTDTAAINKAMSTSYDEPYSDITQFPTYSQESSLRLVTKEDGSFASQADLEGSTGASLKYNDELIQKLGLNYNDETWDTLLNQLSATDMTKIVENSGYKTPALESVGKPLVKDFDGPAGFNSHTMSPDHPGDWTSYPSETVIGQTWSKDLAYRMGVSMASEGKATGLQGWYAPTVNMHRSNYNGRNAETYSEDPILNGYMAAKVVLGAKAYGLHCFVKHFALSELGDNPQNVHIWLTEQNLREIYLKPFEIAVKDGGANTIMSSFNEVGATWSGASYPLLTTILRKEWGFRGSIVTDWCSGNGVMNPTRGVRAGNDTWLNPVDQNGAPLSQTDVISMNCARTATKNVLYTFCNTYAFAKNYDHSKDEVTVELGLTQSTPVFAWWKIILYASDALVVLGCGYWVFRLVKPRKKKEKPVV